MLPGRKKCQASSKKLSLHQMQKNGTLQLRELLKLSEDKPKNYDRIAEEKKEKGYKGLAYSPKIWLNRIAEDYQLVKKPNTVQGWTHRLFPPK
eukprot:419654-Pelagomonas_calceolata.AAC.5